MQHGGIGKLNNSATSSFPLKVHLTQKIEFKNLDYHSIKNQL